MYGDVICNMCLSSLREKKVKVPSGVRVASMYDSKNLEYNNPPVTSVKFDTVRLGKMGMCEIVEDSGGNS